MSFEEAGGDRVPSGIPDYDRVQVYEDQAMEELGIYPGFFAAGVNSCIVKRSRHGSSMPGAIVRSITGLLVCRRS